MSRPKEDREALAGVVERVVFHNPDNGFAVLRVRVRGRLEPVAVVGRLPVIAEGETVQASGGWREDPRHGCQFQAHRLAVSPPDSLEGIRRYLGSGKVHGVGPQMAKRLVKAFGPDVFEVIENEPERLREVPGIGAKRAESLVKGFREQRAVRDIMVFLQTHGLGTARAARIYRTYGPDAATLLSDDPYRLARDIRGIGFRIADGIGRSLGKDREGLPRARAGLGYVLEQARGAGHCGLPREDLLEQAQELLKVPEAILEQALTEELQARRLAAARLGGRDAIFLPQLLVAERFIAQRLGELLRGAPPPWADIDAPRALAWVEKQLDVTLAPSQRAAVETCLGSRVSVITGGPGVGKTTLVNAVLRILSARRVRCELCAPTGRAAKRLAESTGHSARTIHRLLEIDPASGAFRRDRQRPLDCNLLVVDESSMVDVELMAALLEALPAEGSLLLIGDADQLPSVGPGQVLRDLIESGALPVARLREIFRQAGDSRIVRNAHRVNRGLLPELAARPGELSDFYFAPAEDAEDGQRKVVEIVAGRIGRRFGLDPVRDVQVLSPMNRGPLGVRTLNVTLQAVLNPPPASGAVEVERQGWKYRAGDKVMQTENDYEREVFNGDVGRIVSVDPGAEQMIIAFDGRPVMYRFSDLDRLMLAYAVTVHKSQGSEYPAVVIPMSSHHFVMLRRNLLYTALTRGRKLVVVVGQRWALQKAVEEAADLNRHSTLREQLAGLATDS